jgi:hypothetical protein
MLKQIKIIVEKHPDGYVALGIARAALDQLGD